MQKSYPSVAKCLTDGFYSFEILEINKIEKNTGLQHLKEKGMIERVGSTKNGIWKILK